MDTWIERVENLVNILEGSSISELELTEGGTEIIIRRQPGLMASASVFSSSTAQIGVQVTSGAAAPSSRQDDGVAIIAPLTGVYYSSPSPTSPPYVSVGDVVQVGQVVALIEAMKVFNEVQAEIAGRVSALVAPNGEVVQKGDVLLRVQPA